MQKRIFVHPNYEPPKLYNDIALVELGKRIIFNYDGKYVFVKHFPTIQLTSSFVPRGLLALWAFYMVQG